MNAGGRCISGNLIQLALAGNFDVIVHGANCFCTMNAGIARQIRLKFPEAYQADVDMRVAPATRLGTISWSRVVRGPYQFYVVNAYTQYAFGRGERNVDYDALRRAFTRVRIQFHGMHIGYPRIGAGLGGGDWSKIVEIINEVLTGENHTLVVLDR